MMETTPPSAGYPAVDAVGSLAHDLLRGAEEIAEFLYGTRSRRRSVCHLAETSQLPVFRLGSQLCGHARLDRGSGKAREVTGPESSIAHSEPSMARSPSFPDRSAVTETTLLRLSVAAALAYPARTLADPLRSGPSDLARLAVPRGAERPAGRLVRRHVARFISVALYTGTRERLLAHLRRWQATGQCRHHPVEWNGQPVRDVDKAFRAARLAAGLSADVTPHILKHTAITWAMQAGVSKEDAASFFATTVETIERTYWHHHPDFQRDAAEKMGRSPRQKPREQTALNA